MASNGHITKHEWPENGLKWVRECPYCGTIKLLPAWLGGEDLYKPVGGVFTNKEPKCITRKITDNEKR